MQIKVLGCSGGVGPGLRTTSLLVDEETLVDAGTGVGDLTQDQQRRIRRVFLTHSHLDHVCGLAFMADNLFGLLEQPIQVLATAETLAALRAHVFNWTIWPDFSELPSAEHPLIEFVPIAPGEPVALGGGRRITPFLVRHTVPAVGYALESGQGTFVYTGDTWADDGLWDFLNALPRLDQLMVEVAFPSHLAGLAELSRHFVPSVLARELRKLRHRPELLLTHHKPGSEHQIEVECRGLLESWRYRHLRRGDLISA